jgi:hypothetical protein
MPNKQGRIMRDVVVIEPIFGSAPRGRAITLGQRLFGQAAEPAAEPVADSVEHDYDSELDWRLDELNRLRTAGF